MHLPTGSLEIGSQWSTDMFMTWLMSVETYIRLDYYRTMMTIHILYDYDLHVADSTPMK